MEKHIIHCVDNKHSCKFCRNLKWENYIFKSGSHIAKSHIWKTIWKKNKEHQRPPLGRRLALGFWASWVLLNLWPSSPVCALGGPATPPGHLSGCSSAGGRATRVSGLSHSTVCPQSLCYHTVLLGLQLPNSPALSNICQPRDQSDVLGGAAPGKARFQSDPPSASLQGSPSVDKA